MIVSEADPEVMIFMGTHEINWKTENCGKTIVALNQGRPVEEF